METRRKRRPSANAQAKRDFIFDYLKRFGSIEVIDAAFHDEFHELFGGRRVENKAGARPVYRAMRLLEEMTQEGLLERQRVNSDFKLPGVPQWMWVYEKKKERFLW